MAMAMAAAGRRGAEASAWALRSAWGLLGAGRGFRSSAVSEKCHAARVRPRKGNQPVSYEEAHPPHHIAHRKGWLSLHTGNLNGETDAAERTVEDVFIRKFLFGTFHGCLADEIVLKRRANTLIICAILMQNLPPHKIYFLVGYTEVLLSFFYKCPVKMEVQTISEKIIYKCL
ncbi:28S ribosomal protein S24, mitochondrial [Protobothrops mucrosquamatus]|uniref:28S ribosomal protein S24, mitochondrial n=1 Tax=Protobothrops mucrosquamatus TaxID=103944 RepID=UPI000775E8B3|nr:28S ribosomal protein S24, mitochondrial [Protobothrops mucrosquamatus]